MTNANFDGAGRVQQVQGNLGVNYAPGASWVPQGIGVLTLGNLVTETWTYGNAQKHDRSGTTAS